MNLHKMAVDNKYFQLCNYFLALLSESGKQPKTNWKMNGFVAVLHNKPFTQTGSGLDQPTGCSLLTSGLGLWKQPNHKPFL